MKPHLQVIPPKRRAAIYTRKSTEKGLEQEFNSLDAQREACRHYIVMQGWQELPESYDDGGFTGANIDRPAFRQLLADIEARRLEVVVVYKVDRLSRSLVDFARLMAAFEKSGVAFVSVTQNFSTADAMGRFTLNILMSFAEFEREMITERTRDKVRALRRRGKWTGGYVPYGYRLEHGKLYVEESEACVVRRMFRQAEQGETVASIVAGLRRDGFKTRNGHPWSWQRVRVVLGSPYVAGLMSCGAERVEAEHEAIIDRAIYERVNERLASPNQQRPTRPHTSLLGGFTRCACCGSAVTYISNRTRGAVHSYYRCSLKVKLGAAACPSKPVRAGALEDFVVATIRSKAPQTSAIQDPAIATLLRDWDKAWPLMTKASQRKVIESVVEKVIVDEPKGEVRVTLRAESNEPVRFREAA
jgi:site-specific DNA recombinase